MKTGCDQFSNPPTAVWGTSELVIVCPYFWTLPTAPSIDVCPNITSNQVNPTDRGGLIRNQYGVMVHEFAHVYGDTNYGGTATNTNYNAEVCGFQSVIMFSSEAAAQNAMSYAIYAARKASTPLSLLFWFSFGQPSGDGGWRKIRIEWRADFR